MAAADLGGMGGGVRNMMLVVVFQRLLNFTINQVQARAFWT